MTKGSSVPSGYVSFFDLDARAELCRMKQSVLLQCPRAGEQIDYRAQTEEGGGIYIVVNVRHVLEQKKTVRGTETAVAAIVIEVQPMHSNVIEQVASVAIDIPITESSAVESSVI